jgi:glycosyltransferase involved in cell wall biosynthesis
MSKSLMTSLSCSKYRMSLFFLLLATALFSGLNGDLPEKPMVIVIPSYKNIKWYKQNIDSVFMQNYSNYRVIYVDDCSPDGTGNAVESYVEAYDQMDRFLVVKNKKRQGAMANIYIAIQYTKYNEIVVLLDGDDWFFHADVLKQLNEIYSTQEVWFTHGRLLEDPRGCSNWCEPIPPQVISNRCYRQFKCPSHLRTFYAWLFKKIKLDDFLYEGKFLEMTWDMAIMYPLAEMAEERHAFIDDINYVYNVANPINDNKVNAELQRTLDALIRGRPPYNRLEADDIPDFMFEDEDL